MHVKYFTRHGEKQKTRQMCLSGRNYFILPTQATDKKILVIWKKLNNAEGNILV